MRKLAVLTVSAVAFVTACGGGGSLDTTTTEPADTTVSTIDDTTTTSDVSTTDAETTTTTESTTTTEATTTTTTLPGDPIDFGPGEGDTVAVIGVAFDDVLNLRAAPGVDNEIVARIPNTEDALVALGNTRDIDPGFWIELDYDDTTGWVNLIYVGFLGQTTDETSAVVDDLGERPRADTMLDLGMTVAETFASDEPESDLVVVVEPTVGDLGEVTIDVIGLGDDSVAGVRVHVFGQPDDESFTLDSVEVTALCGRGVTDDGLCT